jgi:hypothetical protein
VTPLNRFGRLSPGAVQSRTDVTRRRKRVRHGFDVWLVVIADYSVRSYPCPTQCAAEEGFRTSAVPFVPQQNVHDLAMLINRTVEIAFLFTAEAEDLVHIPLPPQPSPMAMTRLSQLRPEGLPPVEYRTRRDIEMPLGQQLHHMGSGQWVAGIPPNRSQNHVGRPAVAGEGGRGGSRKVTVARATTIPLSAPFLITVSLRSGLLAGRTMNHGHGVYHTHQLISQTLSLCPWPHRLTRPSAFFRLFPTA